MMKTEPESFSALFQDVRSSGPRERAPIEKRSSNVDPRGAANISENFSTLEVSDSQYQKLLAYSKRGNDPFSQVDDAPDLVSSKSSIEASLFRDLDRTTKEAAQVARFTQLSNLGRQDTVPATRIPRDVTLDGALNEHFQWNETLQNKGIVSGLSDEFDAALDATLESIEEPEKASSAFELALNAALDDAIGNSLDDDVRALDPISVDGFSFHELGDFSPSTTFDDPSLNEEIFEASDPFGDVEAVASVELEGQPALYESVLNELQIEDLSFQTTETFEAAVNPFETNEGPNPISTPHEEAIVAPLDESSRARDSLPFEVADEDLMKARQNYDEAVEYLSTQNIESALSCARMAIAYDPMNDMYKNFLRDLGTLVDAQRAKF